MKTIGLGNALVDVLLKLENDNPLAEINITKGVMDMIDEDKMVTIQRTQAHLEKSQAPGGSVCNTVRAMAKLGSNTGFVGKIGSDSIGEYYETALLNAGVKPFFSKTKGITGCSTILISPDGERTMATFLGPAPTLTPEEIKEEILNDFQYIYIEGYLLVNEALVRSTMEKAQKLGLKIALDLSNFNIVNAFKDLLDDIIPTYVNILFSNQSEAEAFTGLEATEAIKEIAKKVDISVVTLGKEGSLICKGEEIIRIPAEGGKPLDTTGAGDHFAAGFLHGQTKGASIEQSGRIGSLLAGYVIDVVGAQIPDQHWEQIKLKVRDILS